MNGSAAIPALRYRDAQAAIRWLETVLGFHAHAVYHGPENTVAHAELTLNGGMVMLGSASNQSPYPQYVSTPEQAGSRVTSGTYLVVPSCEPVYERARESGSEIVQELQEMSYGGKAFIVRDPEGYLWSVGEYDPWQAAEASAKSEV